jgi:hypothetical protein
MFDDFQEKVRMIYRLACRYGEGRLLVNPATGAYDPRVLPRIRHSGYAQAQELIIQELLSVAAKKRELNSRLKSVRRDHKREEAKAIFRDLEVQGFKEAVMRKLADSIAWQLIGGRNDIAQWLYKGEDSQPSIDQSNLASVKEEVDRMNRADTLSFGLLSDLTSFVQVGDILAKRRDTLCLIEVKDGVKNAEAVAIIEKESPMGGPLDLGVVTAGLERHLAGQVERTYKQIVKGRRTEEILNKGRGVDPKSAMPVIVSEPPLLPESYRGELAALVSRLDEEPWAYSVIEECLMVGCYKGPMKKAGMSLLQRLGREFFGRAYPVVSLRASLDFPTCEPVFLKPLGEDQILDIVFDRIRVFMLFDLDWLVRTFNKGGIAAKWLSRKETARLREEDKTKGLFVFDGRAIEVRHEQSSVYLSGGSLARIFFDSLLPSSLVSMFLKDPLKDEAGA